MAEFFKFVRRWFNGTNLGHLLRNIVIREFYIGITKFINNHM